MIVIYKYPIEFRSSQFVKMPEDARLLTIDLQFGQLKLWALVDTNSIWVERIIECYGTGHKMYEKPDVYISTVQLDGFVWHFFDKGIWRGEDVPS